MLIYDNSETSNMLNDYFSTVFTKEDTSILPFSVQFNVYDVPLELIYFSVEDVDKLKTNKSTRHLVLIKFILLLFHLVS